MIIIPPDEDAIWERAKRPNTPENLAAVARGLGLYTSYPGVILQVRVPGFRVPEDGMWTINGLVRPAGEVVDLDEGAVVTYTPVQDGKAHRVPVLLAAGMEGRMPTGDRVTGRVHVPRPDATDVLVGPNGQMRRLSRREVRRLFRTKKGRGGGR